MTNLSIKSTRALLNLYDVLDISAYQFELEYGQEVVDRLISAGLIRKSSTNVISCTPQGWTLSEKIINQTQEWLLIFES